MSIQEWSQSVAILICTYNRPQITHLCLENILRTKQNAKLFVYDDGSWQLTESWLRRHADEVIVRSQHKEHGSWSVAQGRKALMAQAIRDPAIDWVYNTDSDCYHDPEWLHFLYKMQSNTPNFNIFSLMNSSHQAKRGVTTSTEEQREFRVARRVEAPGASFMVRASALRDVGEPFGITEKGVQEHGAWDHLLAIHPQIGNYQTLVSEVSYLDHFSAGGIHADWDDRCLNLTPYLEVHRPAIGEYLNLKATDG